MSKPSVAIIDYGMGNLFSVNRACEAVGLCPVITSDRNVIAGSDGAILPGVGAFGDAMDNLRRLDLIGFVKDFIASGKPLMGICLGMQLLVSSSDEFGYNQGLDIVKGRVRKIPSFSPAGNAIKVPQIGWNTVSPASSASSEGWRVSPLGNLKSDDYMYFVHSYMVVLENEEDALSVTDYEGVEYCSSFIHDNVFGCQFHPEKSAAAGLGIYKKWGSLLYDTRRRCDGREVCTKVRTA